MQNWLFERKTTDSYSVQTLFEMFKKKDTWHRNAKQNLLVTNVKNQIITPYFVNVGLDMIEMFNLSQISRTIYFGKEKLNKSFSIEIGDSDKIPDINLLMDVIRPFNECESNEMIDENLNNKDDNPLNEIINMFPDLFTDRIGRNKNNST